VDEFVPLADAAYIYTPTSEERTRHVERWQQRPSQPLSLSLIENDRAVIASDTSTVELDLRDQSLIRDFLNALEAKAIYFDITGMPYHAWAPLIRAADGLDMPLRALYAEPREYRYNENRTEDEVFDLSRSTKGIAPLPGFAVMREAEPSAICLVPLLGFEGSRLMGIVRQVDPPSGMVFPIVGLPGFRPEYVFHTLQGNRSGLLSDKAWKQISWVAADCPFDAYYALEKIFTEAPGRYLKLAPIGTRPHALAAVAFVVRHFERAELVYDYPIEVDGRTQGVGELHEYSLNALLGVR